MASGYPDWLRAFSMLGKHGDDYKVVAVDVDGNLYALLQGETVDEELRTVRLDDEGRMSAFVIDSVDAWDRMLTIGNTELAARLGSSVIYDKRGQVLFVESFERGWYRWISSEGGAGADGAVTPVYAATGGYSVKLTGGDDGARFASIQRRVASRPLGKMGFEFSFSMPGGWDYIHARMLFYTGALSILTAVKFIYATGNFEIFDDDLGYTPVGSGEALGEDGGWFNVIKFVADVDALEWVRLMYNNQEIALGAYTLRSAVDLVTPPGIVVDITVYSRADNNDVMYVDDVILTSSEPE